MPATRLEDSRGLLLKRLMSGPLTARRAAGIIAVFTLVLTLLGAGMVFLVDRDEFPNLGLAGWWALQTVTTVGYGDFVPQNTAGRVVGSLVMLVGISFIAVVTASIAAALVEAARRRAEVDLDIQPLGPQFEEIVARLDRIEQAMERRPGQDDA
jgi:voltage-gated potassium channel